MLEAAVESSSEENTQEKDFEDWQQCTDVGTGQHYYFNPKTQSTQWELPSGLNVHIIPTSENKVIQTEAFPPLVQSRVDPSNAFVTTIATGSTYVETATTCGFTDALLLTNNADANSEVSNGWQQYVDPDSKRSYYYNTFTEERQWEPPADHIALSGPPSATDRYIYYSY